MIKHSAPLSGIAAFKNKYVATAGYDNRVILWDAKSKEPLARGWHDHLANQCRFSADGKILVSSSSDYSARIWSVPDMKLLACCLDHQDDVEAVALHPTKPLLATACRDNLVRVFDLDGKLVGKMQGHCADVISVEWVGESDELISSSDDGTIKRWDYLSQKMLEDFDLGSVETDTVVITENGLVIAGNDEGQLLIIQGSKQKAISAHEAGIKRIVYNSEYRLLVSLSYDRTINIWEVEGDKVTKISESELPSVIWPRSADFLGKEKLVFVTFGDSYAEFDIKSGDWSIDHINHTHGINAVATLDGGTYTVGDSGVVKKAGVHVSDLSSLCNFLTPFDSTLIAGGQTGEVFDALSGRVIYQHRSPLNCATVFEHYGVPHIMVGSYTGEGIILKEEEGSICFVKSVQLHQNAIKDLATNKGSILSVCATGAARIIDTEDFSTLYYDKNAHSMIANGCVSLSQSGGFASVSRDLQLRLISESECLAIKTPHTNSIKCVSASEDGRFIATGSYVGRVGIYDVKNSKFVDFKRVSTAGISKIAFSVESQQFLASAYDGKVYQISLPTDNLSKVGGL